MPKKHPTSPRSSRIAPRGDSGHRTRTPRSSRSGAKHGARPIGSGARGHANRHASKQPTRSQGYVGKSAPGSKAAPVIDIPAIAESINEIFKGSDQPLSPEESVLLTRRRFLFAGVGVAAVAALAGGSAIASSLNKDDGDLNILTVPTSNVTVNDDLTYLEDPSALMGLTANIELPYGSLVWANDDDYAAALIPTEAAAPLTQIAVVFLGAGTYSTVLEQAVGLSDGFEIYDVRLCKQGMVWTEADILEGIWRIYSATWDGSSLGTPALMEEGRNADWQTPTIAAVGKYAWWQVLPNLEGSMATEDSTLRYGRFGVAESKVCYVSHGRFCSAPYAMDDKIVISPRADTSGTYYQLTLLDAGNGQVLDSMVMPQSMRPLEIGYGKTGFMFCFDVIYNYGDGIAELGSYAPMKDARQGNYSSVPWFRFGRTPTAAPCWCGNLLMVKSTRAVAGISFSTNEYFALDVMNGSDSYGDYLASTGDRSRIVTFSNIDYQPVNDTAQRYCCVRVWGAYE